MKRPRLFPLLAGAALALAVAFLTLPVVAIFVEASPAALVSALGDREHLAAGRFTAADLLMTSVLRILRTTKLVEERPTLLAYRSRFEARAAFQRALAAQMKTFEENAPRSA